MPDTVICPNCGAANRPDMETCDACGTALSLSARVLSRQTGGFAPEWLDRTRAEAPRLKEEGEAASQSRMAGLVEIDRRREAAQDLQRRSREAQDRRVLLVAVVGIAVILLIVLGAALAATF